MKENDNTTENLLGRYNAVSIYNICRLPSKSNLQILPNIIRGLNKAIYDIYRAQIFRDYSFSN